MARVSAGEKGVYVALPIDLVEAVTQLAARNGRPIKDEFAHALRRHLEAPPQLVTPELAAAVEPVETPKKRGKNPKGRAVPKRPTTEN